VAAERAGLVEQVQSELGPLQQVVVSQKTCSIGRVPNLKRIATILPRGQIA
jgi:hypothetical protein